MKISVGCMVCIPVGNLRSMGHLTLQISLNVTTSAFVKKKNSKMRHLKKSVKTNGGQIKEQDLRFPAGMIRNIRRSGNKCSP